MAASHVSFLAIRSDAAQGALSPRCHHSYKTLGTAPCATAADAAGVGPFGALRKAAPIRQAASSKMQRRWASP